MKRELIDKKMSQMVTNKVIVPLVRDLGAKYLVEPYLKSYEHENKTIEWGLGYKKHKKHSGSRHRTIATFEGIHYRDGELTEGETRTIETDRRLGWSRMHDNRLVANKQTVKETILSYDETFNKLRTLTSLDVVQSWSATAQGEVAGFGGSVSSSTSISAHTEVETEKFNHTKRERKIEDEVELAYPVGDIWLIERPLMTLQTIQPVAQWGIWDCGQIIINIYDWAGDRSIMPSGEHSNVLKFNGLAELVSFMRREFVLQYPWSEKYRPSDEARAGLRWLKDESKRNVGPVEWDRVRINEDVAAIQPGSSRRRRRG